MASIRAWRHFASLDVDNQSLNKAFRGATWRKSCFIAQGIYGSRLAVLNLSSSGVIVLRARGRISDF